MRTIEEIRQQPYLMVKETDQEGGSGVIVFGKMQASVIFSWGAGWDHVSIAPFKWHYTPTWDDMCKLKNLFFYPEETVIQYHPAESQYVNQMGNCLHLWRPQGADIPLPPPVLTGARRGQSRTEIEREIQAAYENPYALTDKMLLPQGKDGWTE